MRTVISYVSRYEDHFRAVMEQKLRLSSEAAIRGHKKRLAQAEKRLGELDRLFIRIYEDNVAGRITDEKFSMMSKTYEDEQAQLKEEIQTLQQEIEVQERQIENLEQFIQRVRKYEDLDELTPYALRELVKAIYIEAPDKSSGKRHQGIRISYDLVGFIPVEELLKQERRDRSHAVPEKIRYYFLMTPASHVEGFCQLFLRHAFCKAQRFDLAANVDIHKGKTPFPIKCGRP